MSSLQPIGSTIWLRRSKSLVYDRDWMLNIENVNTLLWLSQSAVKLPRNVVLHFQMCSIAGSGHPSILNETICQSSSSYFNNKSKQSLAFFYFSCAKLKKKVVATVQSFFILVECWCVLSIRWFQWWFLSSDFCSKNNANSIGWTLCSWSSCGNRFFQALFRANG